MTIKELIMSDKSESMEDEMDALLKSEDDKKETKVNKSESLDLVLESSDKEQDTDAMSSGMVDDSILLLMQSTNKVIKTKRNCEKYD